MEGSSQLELSRSVPYPGLQDDLRSRSTHNVSSVGVHVSDIQEAAHTLQAAVDRNWMNRGSSRYSEVHVLLIRWEDDDLGVERELLLLGHIFINSYHYSVEYWNIPSEKPAQQLQDRVSEFWKKDSQDVLLIVYYAGHALQNESMNEPPFWYSRRENYARVPSSILQSGLAECDADVLLLYDCCHAVPTSSQVVSRSVKEYFAACGFEGRAAEVGPDSFSFHLIQELELASYSSVSTGELYARLINRLKTWRPEIVGSHLGLMKINNNNGRAVFSGRRRRTPIHGPLTTTSRGRSIILSTLPQSSLHDYSPSTSGLSSASTSFSASNHSSGLASSQDDISNQSRKRRKYDRYPEEQRQNKRRPPEVPFVLLKIQIDTPYFDQDAWREWLRDIPPEATKIKVDGIYDSLSTLILVRMPITTWKALPENPAYSFIGFVTSENKLPSLQKDQENTPIPEAGTRKTNLDMMFTPSPSSSSGERISSPPDLNESQTESQNQKLHDSAYATASWPSEHSQPPQPSQPFPPPTTSTSTSASTNTASTTSADNPTAK